MKTIDDRGLLFHHVCCLCQKDLSRVGFETLLSGAEFHYRSCLTQREEYKTLVEGSSKFGGKEHAQREAADFIQQNLDELTDHLHQMRAEVHLEMLADRSDDPQPTPRAQEFPVAALLEKLIDRIEKLAAVRPAVNFTVPENAFLVSLPEKKRTPINVKFKHDADGRIVGMEG